MKKTAACVFSYGLGVLAGSFVTHCLGLKITMLSLGVFAVVSACIGLKRRFKSFAMI